MGAEYGTKLNLNSDEDPYCDIYEELIKYNSELRKGKKCQKKKREG